MSKALIQASRLDADIRLASAIRSFETHLSPRQRAELSNGSTPTQADVMRVTAQLDRELSKNGVRRGYGPRITNMLESVQQFASMGDVLIGGSQNLPASAVWMIVRFSLLAFVQHSTYINEISELFMEIGRSSPRYIDLQALYPRSKSLQICVIEYQILIVQLCDKIQELTKASAFKQLWQTFSKSTIIFRMKLERYAAEIRDEVEAQMALQARVQTNFISKIHRLTSQQLDQQKASHETSIIAGLADLCSSYDSTKRWKQFRKLGSTTLFLNNQEYQSWSSKTKSATLIYSGILGSGKSVLLANLVDEINLKLDAKTEAAAFFFCEPDIPESLEPTTVLGSIARQLILRTSHEENALIYFNTFLARSVLSLDIDDLYNIISFITTPLKRTVLILDGLDAFSVDQRELLFATIKKLQRNVNLSMCISARDEPDTASKFTRQQLFRPIFTRMPKDNADIMNFIDSELRRLKREGKLVVSCDDLIAEIQDELLKQSNGMFLWVSLQLSSLCDLDSDYAIKTALKNLPKTLSETYAIALEIPEGPRAEHQLSILAMLMTSKRHLTKKELKVAAGVAPGDVDSYAGKPLNIIDRLLASFRGVVVIEEEELTVGFVHPSALQFLRDGRSPTIDIMKAERRAAEIVLTYLNFPMLENRVAKASLSRPDVISMPRKIIKSTTASSRVILLLIRLITNTKGKKNVDINNVLAEIRGTGQPPPAEDCPFASYAKEFWFEHLCFVQHEVTTCLTLLKQSISKKRIFLEDISCGTSPLVEIANSGHKDIFLLFIEQGCYSDEERAMAFWAASNNGRSEIVAEMLILQSFRTSWRDPTGITALIAAAISGSADTTMVLLKCSSINVNEVEINGWTALMHAASRGYFEVAQIILQHPKTDPNIEGEDSASTISGKAAKDTALQLAVRNSHTDIVQILLRHPSTVVTYPEPEELLSIAVKRRDMKTYRALLTDKRIKPDAEFYLTKLLASAAVQGRMDDMEILFAEEGLCGPRISTSSFGEVVLSVGSHGPPDAIYALLKDERFDPNVQAVYGVTPLMYAVERGSVPLVQAILADKRTDPNLYDRYENQALSYAAKHDDMTLLRTLLADPRTMPATKVGFNETFLTRAVNKNREDILRLMLKDGRFNPNMRDERGRTALSIAVLKSNINLVTLLLRDKRIDPNIPDADNWSSLWHAKGRDITELLLAHEKIDTTLVARLSPHRSTGQFFGETGTVLMAAMEDEDYFKVEAIEKSGKVDIKTQSSMHRTVDDINPWKYVGKAGLSREDFLKFLTSHSPSRSQCR